jgi:uncharacterized protein YbaR (Trm112 family)
VGKGALRAVPATKRSHIYMVGTAQGRLCPPYDSETALMNNSSPERTDATVDPKLLEILVCPLTKGPLEFDSARQELISRSAKLAYPIRDGIPIMLPEEARKIE